MIALYIDPIGGIAGDMLCAALIDLGLDQELWQKRLASLPLDNYRMEIKKCMRNSFSATHLTIRPIHVHHHEHHHDHHTEPWGHHHRGFSDISSMIEKSTLPSIVKKNAISVFRALGDAEAKIHGCTIEEIHFHEVGATDSILDIVGFCLGIHMLGISELYAAPPPLSYGHTHGAHGHIPLPAPATLSLLREKNVREGYPNHEQTTPTGAAFLKALCKESAFPTTQIKAIGYGAGTRNPQDYPNVLRVLLCAKQSKEKNSTIVSIQTHVDDMTGEGLPILIERCLDAGALDVFAQPIIMKKGRMGYLITALAREENQQHVEEAIFNNTSTFGVRYTTMHRTELERIKEPVTTPWGIIHVKVGKKNQEYKHASVEYEDAAYIARTQNISLHTVYQTTLALWREQCSSDS
ncbi:MAG: TIGR00299 family protein [Deltaproteobacteria bacterium]|nr:TIGR00299 family protein [Deltaproteobacteria bacterium]